MGQRIAAEVLAVAVVVDVVDGARRRGSRLVFNELGTLDLPLKRDLSLSLSISLYLSLPTASRYN